MRLQQVSWHMFPNLCDLKKLAIKDKSQIPIIDDNIDELPQTKFITKIYLQMVYHKIKMKDMDTQDNLLHSLGSLQVLIHTLQPLQFSIYFSNPHE